MTIYHMVISVKPTEKNEHFKNIEGANVSCWVRDYDSESAYAKARFDIKRSDWEILKVIDKPVQVKLEDFSGKDLGQKHYNKALKKGKSCIYVAWSKEGREFEGEYEIKSSHTFNLQYFLSNQKKYRNNGRCLHYSSGSRCNEIIKAHSIQEKGLLSEISKNQHVYQFSTKFSDYDGDKRQITLALEGLKKASIFKGFCKYHDNELFEPIDNFPLRPSHQQAFLYAYRSLCKELFVKENALHLFKEGLESVKEHEAYSELFTGLYRGTQFGYDNLLRQKQLYDKSLETENFNDFNYVAFFTESDPCIAFSGVLFPEIDFLGNELQDLSNQAKSLDLISFCSAPTDTGWAIIFAWHLDSSNTCQYFIESLEKVVYQGADLADTIFRLVITSCENMAISPSWWESLNKPSQDSILEKASLMADVFTLLPKDHLKDGLNGIVNWQFSKIFSEYKKA